MMTTSKLSTGQFSVSWNGNDTGYRIVNGSLGYSGQNTQNMYGIVNPQGGHKWIGSLVSCKKVLALTLKRQQERRS